MTWAGKKDAIRRAIALCLDLPDFLGADGLTTIHQVEWENKRDSNRMVGDVWADINLSNVTVLGQDEHRFVEVDTGIASSYGGNRLMSVTVRMCSTSQEDNQETVGMLAEKLRLRFRQPGPRALYEAAEVALVALGGTFETDYRDQNGRIVSCSVTELRLSTVAVETDLTSVGDYVESVELTNVTGGDCQSPVWVTKP